MAAVGNASLGNLFITIKANTKGALDDIQKVVKAAEAAAGRIDALNKAAGRVQAPKTPTAPRTPTAPKPSASGSGGGGSSRSSQKQVSDLDRVSKKLRDIQETSRNISKSNDAIGAELASDSVLNRIKKLRAELKNLLPSLKTADEKAKVQALLGTLEQVNKQTRESRRVAKLAPDKVAETGSVGAAVKAVKAEETAAVKARQEARLKGIEGAKKYLEELRKAQAKADADAKKSAEKAAADAKRVADKAAADAKKAAEKAAADAQKVADRSAAAAKKAQDKAAADAQKAADRAAAAVKKAQDKAAADAQKAADRAASATKKAADKAAADAQKAADRAAAAVKKAQDKADREAQRAKDRAGAAARRAADKAAADLQRAQDRAARDAKRAADKAAAATQRAADKAAAKATREAAKAAKEAEKAAAKATARFKSGVSGLTSGISKNLGKGLADGVTQFGAAAAALRYGNIFGGISSGARAVVGLFTNATKTVNEFGESVANASIKGGPFGVVFGVVAAGALLTVAGYAAKAAIQFANFAAQAITVGATLKTLFTTGFSGAENLEQTGLTLEAVLGSRAKAEKEYLIQRDRASLYDFKGLQELDRTLLAFNVTNDDTRRGLVDTLVTLGTVGGRSVDQLGFAARALGQISANGTPLRQDILQLVQSLGVSEKVLQSLPEYAGKSSAELRKMLEQGLIPSVTFFKALGVYAEQFGPIAAKAAGTFRGQVNNIKDTFETGLSDAFLATGVLDAAAKLANRVLQILQTIDFKPIGAGFAAVIQAISQGLGGITGSQGAQSVKSFFEVTLPNILYKVAYLANFVAQVFSGFFQRFIGNLGQGETKVKTFGDGVLGLVKIAVKLSKAFAFVYAILRVVFAVAKTLAAPLTAAFRLFGGIFKAILRASKGDFKGAGAALGEVVRTVFDDLNPTDDIQKALKDYSSFVTEIDAAAERAGNIKFEPFTPIEPTGDGLGDQAQPPFDPNADDVRKSIDDLRNQLYDLTRRIYGLRSELEKGLLGEVGFDATKEQIAQIGNQVTDILRQLGKGGLAAAIDRQVVQLMRLADLRDAVAKELEVANKRLEDAIKARDDFADQIRKQAISFVNALKLEEETVDRISTFKVGGITGYLVAQVKESQKYVDVLRKRLNTFRDFQRKTKQLAQRGLDKSVLEQLVAAGPEEAGEIVDQLASSGDDVIREVNSIQRELGQVAKDAGQSQAAFFYQAGVDQAQAQAKGLLSQIAYLSSVAELLGQAIYNAVVPFAKKTGDAIAGAVSGPVGGGGGGSRPPAPPAPPAPPRNPLAEFLLAAQKQINDAVLQINQRSLFLTKAGFTPDQIQNDRKFLLTDLVKRYPGLVKVPDKDGFRIGVYIGGQKITEYVDVALLDALGRRSQDWRRGGAPGEAAPGAPGSVAPNPFGNGNY